MSRDFRLFVLHKTLVAGNVNYLTPKERGGVFIFSI